MRFYFGVARSSDLYVSIAGSVEHVGYDLLPRRDERANKMVVVDGSTPPAEFTPLASVRDPICPYGASGNHAWFLGLVRVPTLHQGWSNRVGPQ